jgi:hypothetical protein
VIRGVSGIGPRAGGGFKITSQRIIALVELEDPAVCIYCGETMGIYERAYFIDDPSHRCKPEKCSAARDAPHVQGKAWTAFAHPERLCPRLRVDAATD